jgi:hypothetical protein
MKSQMLVNLVELGNNVAPGVGFVVQILDEAGVNYGAADAPENAAESPRQSVSVANCRIVARRQTDTGGD